MNNHSISTYYLSSMIIFDWLVMDMFTQLVLPSTTWPLHPTFFETFLIVILQIVLLFVTPLFKNLFLCLLTNSPLISFTNTCIINLGLLARTYFRPMTYMPLTMSFIKLLLDVFFLMTQGLAKIRLSHLFMMYIFR